LSRLSNEIWISWRLIDTKRRPSTVWHDATLSSCLLGAVLFLFNLSWIRFIHWNTFGFNISKKITGSSNYYRLIMGHSLILDSLYAFAPNLFYFCLVYAREFWYNALSPYRNLTLTFHWPFLKSVAHAKLRILACQRLSSMNYSKHAS